MDALLLQIVLLIFGFVFGLSLFLFILVPLLYGFPHLLAWLAKKYLEWRTPFLYLLVPSFWIVAFLVFVHQLGFLFSFYVTNSRAFTAGLWLGIIVEIIKLALSVPARLKLRGELLNFATPYLTPVGAVSLRGLWPRMTNDLPIDSPAEIPNGSKGRSLGVRDSVRITPRRSMQPVEEIGEAARLD